MIYLLMDYYIFFAEYREKQELGDERRNERRRKEAARWTGVIAAALHFQMRWMYAVQACSCGGAAGGQDDDRVLPGGLEM